MVGCELASHFSRTLPSLSANAETFVGGSTGCSSVVGALTSSVHPRNMTTDASARASAACLRNAMINLLLNWFRSPVVPGRGRCLFFGCGAVRWTLHADAFSGDCPAARSAAYATAVPSPATPHTD